MCSRPVAEDGVAPGDITDILLTHAHYDHAANHLTSGSAAPLPLSLVLGLPPAHARSTSVWPCLTLTL
ncbi:MBL fold metallo-hydrolase [Nonomuraea jabiensis]|uniref:MBL fold metallo-hydrolase n=1 Tax=Nonomuraea jabiensis TaxID=882448 RepID=UPI0034232072